MGNNDGISDNILSLIDKTPTSILKSVALRVKDRRLGLNLTQKALAGRADIPISTYRRFERTGEISLRSLVMLAIALDLADGFNLLFEGKAYKNLDEIIKLTENKNRKRVR